MKILHLFGPIYIQSYGICIALGLLAFMNLMYRDARRAVLLTYDQFISLITIGIAAAIIGGRVLYILTEFSYLHSINIFEIWHGGFSVLGSIIAVIATIPFFLNKHGIPLFSTLDLCATYAPLLQSISRIGCFFAGCCFGKPTNSFFGIMYSTPFEIAPALIKIHPTQLYSSIILFSIFLFLYIYRKNNFFDGSFLYIYLVCASLERFFVDFFRGDQQFSNSLPLFSINQWLSLFIFCGATCFFCIRYYNKSYEPL
ncbi:MAG: prolipoprotein diacylglyceryl transferase [Candidatus Babeliales bacterium]